MEVHIQNDKISPIIKLLYDLELKGKQSRHRTKFIQQLDDHLKVVGKDEEELLKEHCYLDGEGEPKRKEENGREVWDVKDLDKFITDKRDLLSETYVFEGSNVQETLKTVKAALDECDVAFSGQDATLYDYLCDQFEKDEDESKDKTNEDVTDEN